ncbi:MAG: hypothetical protein JO244_02075 [Solirubrobacterales bacterium]|nr:hypothetical protein [Solirubrobacterales bacterium]
MHVYAETTGDWARRIGLATLVALLLAIAGLWHGVSFLGNQGADGATGATMFWLLADLGGGILSWVLVVIYLRHLFRTADTSPSRSTWMLAILLLGPFAMPFYWWAHMRRAPYSSPHTLNGERITGEEARLLATISVGPPSPTDTP